MVFVSESFDLPLARKLATLILGSQGSGPLQSASITNRTSGNSIQFIGENTPPESLTGPMVHFLSHCGVTRAVLDAAVQSTKNFSH